MILGRADLFSAVAGDPDVGRQVGLIAAEQAVCLAGWVDGGLVSWRVIDAAPG